MAKENILDNIIKEKLVNDEIVVKNAEGDPDTKATILIKNKIDYIQIGRAHV